MKEVEESRPDLLRVCYFGTYRANYTRNQILLAGLRTQDNVVVYECYGKVSKTGLNRQAADGAGLAFGGVSCRRIGAFSGHTIKRLNMM